MNLCRDSRYLGDYFHLDDDRLEFFFFLREGFIRHETFSQGSILWWPWSSPPLVNFFRPHTPPPDNHPTGSVSSDLLPFDRHITESTAESALLWWDFSSSALCKSVKNSFKFLRIHFLPFSQDFFWYSERLRFWFSWEAVRQNHGEWKKKRRNSSLGVHSIKNRLKF